MVSKSNAPLAGLILFLIAGGAFGIWYFIFRQQPAAVPRQVAGNDSELNARRDRTEKNPQDVPVVLAVPEEIITPFWLEDRRQAQLKKADQLEVFHQFQFTDRVAESGIRFIQQITPDSGRDYKPVHYDHGNGLAVADVNGDELLDLYFTTQLGANELWKNLGDGRFENITPDAGVAVDDRVSVAASFADIDNDGDADLFVTSVRKGNLLFENDGTGVFRDITASAGLAYHGHSSGSIFFDYNRDGLLDLFLCNVGVYTKEELIGGEYYLGFKDAFSGHLKPDERNERNILYRNLGGNRFEDVSDEVNLTDESWTGDAAVFDYNQDGWLDLYILNMQGHDQFYENDEGRSFVRKSREIFPKTPWGAMGIDVFDFEHDGDWDIFITDMHSDMSKDIVFDATSEMSVETGFRLEKEKSLMTWPESMLQSGGMSLFGNAFYRNEGNGTFQEASDELGAENYWPWGLSVGDLNADGYEDVFITASMNYPYRYAVNSLLLNNRGTRFIDSEFIVGVEPRREGRTAKPWFTLDCDGEDRDHPLCKDRSGKVEVWGSLGSRSSVLLDLQEDGDLDIVTNEFNDRPMVLISNLSDVTKVSYLKLRLVGTASNRDGLGTRVTVSAGSNNWHYYHDGKSGYLSQSRMPLYIGLGSAESIERVELSWPSGVQQTIEGPIETNQLLEITEGQPQQSP